MVLSLLYHLPPFLCTHGLPFLLLHGIQDRHHLVAGCTADWLQPIVSCRGLREVLFFTACSSGTSFHDGRDLLSLLRRQLQCARDVLQFRPNLLFVGARPCRLTYPYFAGNGQLRGEHHGQDHHHASSRLSHSHLQDYCYVATSISGLPGNEHCQTRPLATVNGKVGRSPFVSLRQA